MLRDRGVGIYLLDRGDSRTELHGVTIGVKNDFEPGDDSKQVGEIELIRPTRNGARRAPLFRTLQR